MLVTNKVVEVTVGNCPWCNAEVRLEKTIGQSGFKSLHAAPLCNQWDEYCKTLGGKLEGKMEREPLS